MAARGGQAEGRLPVRPCASRGAARQGVFDAAGGVAAAARMGARAGQLAPGIGDDHGYVAARILGRIVRGGIVIENAKNPCHVRHYLRLSGGPRSIDTCAGRDFLLYRRLIGTA